MLPLLKEFKETRLREGTSPYTIKHVCNNVVYFSRYLGHEDMKKVSPKDVEKYQIYLMTEYRMKDGNRLKDTTVSHRLNDLVPYFQFLAQKRFIFFDPTLNKEFPKPEKRLPDYIPSEKDIEDVLNGPDTNVFMGIRDRAIFELMYTCPLRNIEVRGLELSDLDMKGRYIYPTRAKGGRECGIPITDSLYQVLEKYLEIARPRLARRSNRFTDKLFLSERGGPFKAGGINQILVRYRGAKKIHPHSFRHACAVHMLKHGARIRDIQVLLGHRNLSSTQIYTRLTANDIKDIQDKYHPREKRFRRAAANRRV